MDTTDMRAIERQLYDRMVEYPREVGAGKHIDVLRDGEWP
jgi:hypothetical protein